MSQLERDKRAIRTVLQQTGGTTRDEIALRAGEDLRDAMVAMVASGEIVTADEFVAGVGAVKTVYRLAPAKPINRQDIVEHMTSHGIDDKMAGMVADFVMVPMAPLALDPVTPPSIESIRKVEEIFAKAAVSEQSEEGKDQ